MIEMTAPPESSVADARIAEPGTRLNISVASTSVSLAITSVVTAAFSVVLAASATATGASLAPVIAIASEEDTVASPSVTSMLNVSVKVSGISIDSSVTT